jgi:hypothetical protein
MNEELIVCNKNKMQHKAEQDFIDIITSREPELNLLRLVLTNKCRRAWMIPNCSVQNAYGFQDKITPI